MKETGDYSGRDDTVYVTGQIEVQILSEAQGNKHEIRRVGSGAGCKSLDEDEKGRVFVFVHVKASSCSDDRPRLFQNKDEIIIIVTQSLHSGVIGAAL